MSHLGDTNKMVSATPRMDASAHDDGAIWQTGCDIERELNAANVEIEEKRKDIVYIATEKAKLENHVKRLEEAGSLALGYAAKGDLESADEVWDKAKEAKL